MGAAQLAAVSAFASTSHVAVAHSGMAPSESGVVSSSHELLHDFRTLLHDDEKAHIEHLDVQSLRGGDHLLEERGLFLSSSPSSVQSQPLPSTSLNVGSIAEGQDALVVPRRLQLT